MLKVVENGSLREAGWDLFELDKIALAGARWMLITALKTEAADYVERHGDERDAEGRALVVHNGRSKGRKLTMGAGTWILSHHGSTIAAMMSKAGASASPVVSYRLTCGVHRKSPRCCPSYICVGSRPAISAPRWKGCWAKMRPVCRRPTSPDLPPAGKKNTPPFASAI